MKMQGLVLLRQIDVQGIVGPDAFEIAKMEPALQR